MSTVAKEKREDSKLKYATVIETDVSSVAEAEVI